MSNFEKEPYSCSGKRGLDPYRGRQWRGGKEREGARIIAVTAVQDAVIRKCIFTNEVSGMVDGVKRAVMAERGREEVRRGAGGRRWLLVWVVNHGAAGHDLLEAGRQGIPS